MEIEKAEALNTKDARTLREGDVVRVRMVRDLGKGLFLVDVRGKLLSARLSGDVASSLFIARVIKTSPFIELRYLKSLDRDSSPFKIEKLVELLQNKKAFIQKLFISDNLPVIKGKNGVRGIREVLKRSVRNQNPSHVMNRHETGSSEYYILQNLINLIRANSFVFLFPLRFDQKKLLCDLQVFGGRDTANHTLYLSILFEGERQIGFLVFIDYEIIKCTVSASEERTERVLRENASLLVKNLRSLGYNRSISIDFVPFDEHTLFISKMVKRVDVRM